MMPDIPRNTKDLYALRKETIERVFADAKEKHAMRYTFYRGLAQVSNWVRLKFAAMNLKKLARWKARRSFLSFLHSLPLYLSFLFYGLSWESSGTGPFSTSCAPEGISPSGAKSVMD